VYVYKDFYCVVIRRINFCTTWRNLTDSAWPTVAHFFTKSFFELNLQIICQDRIIVGAEGYLPADSQGVYLIGKQGDGFHKDY
jgi:hypothetical protein